jgi:hypothetical protein
MDPSPESYEFRLRRLQRLLDSSPAVNRHNTPDENEAATLSHALLDLEGSFQKFVQELLPKLETGDIDENEIRDILHAIGEEFRHVLYHIGDPKYYRYLPPWGSAERRDDGN